MPVILVQRNSTATNTIPPFVDAVSSSQAASLHGHKAKTPIIAGSICGGVMGLAWIIGFAIYFRKRYKRKLRNRAIAAGQVPEEQHKNKGEPTEKIVIPPDPAILLGHRPGSRVVPEGKTRNHADSQLDVHTSPDAKACHTHEPPIHDSLTSS